MTPELEAIRLLRIEIENLLRIVGYQAVRINALEMENGRLTAQQLPLQVNGQFVFGKSTQRARKDG